MNDAPRHTSLEAEFAALVPPPRLSRLRLLLWRLVFKALSLRPLQRFIEKRYGS
ncbi:MAG: hypothetical protein ABW278_01545 [Steroidobacteraceae bacterium]